MEVTPSPREPNIDQTTGGVLTVLFIVKHTSQNNESHGTRVIETRMGLQTNNAQNKETI
jgi:primosomal replication protein N